MPSRLRRAGFGLTAALILAVFPHEAKAESWCVYPDVAVACLNEVDEDDVGTRTPLILIHGWNSDSIPADPHKDTWNNFIDYLRRDVSLSRTFKPYTFTYQSNLVGVDSLALALRDVFRMHTDSRAAFGSKRIVIVAHSMGGLIARSFLRVGQGDGSFRGSLGGDRTILLITLATPHHGSPLANGPAMTAKLQERSSLLADLWLDVNDWFYLTFSPRWWELNRSELRWDDFDGVLNYSNSSYASERNDVLEELNADRRFDSKITAYAGYFETCNGFFHPKQCGINSVLENLLGESSDGVVPLSSALFYTTPSGSPRFRTRSFAQHNHSEMAEGRSNGSLFAQLKRDLLEAVPALTTIGGRVFDATNNRSISGATVEVLGTGLRTTTDGNGQYRLAGINAVTFTVRYSHPSYRTLDFEYTFESGTERLDLVNGLTPAPSPYDGSWTGSGSGTSSGSTPASTGISFQASGSQITFNFNWTIQQLPPYPSGFICPGSGRNVTLPITNNSFVFSGADDVYVVRITGTFTSSTTVSGSASFQRVGTSWPQCPSATINWSGRKQ